MILAVISISYNCKAQITQIQIQQNLTNVSSNLIGTWTNEDDSNWKIEFSANNTCKWYYNSHVTDTFVYSISTTSPQCGQQVKTGGAEDFYLVLSNLEDNICYEILGVNNENLSLNKIDVATKIFFFQKN